MASGKEIRTQISSVQNTQKITRAMEMVAASKMRKAQDRMAASRPYADKMRAVINHLAFAHSEYKHSYLEERDVKRVGYIIVSSDRGLCGGLNNNLFGDFRNCLQAIWNFSRVSVVRAAATFLSGNVGSINIIGDCNFALFISLIISCLFLYCFSMSIKLYLKLR